MTQQEALDILKLGHNVYLTGSAGSGKTFLLNRYIEYLKKKKIEIGITASTGIAATHINGITIHSWAGIGIKDKLTDGDIFKLLKKRYLMQRFKKTKVLIIDEVSMLHSFRLDIVNRVCSLFKQNGLPFGGLQVVLCGDFFQLPPISKNGEEANFINKSLAWQEINLKVCYLHEQHRHNDDASIGVLNDIRTNSVGEHTLIPLRKRYRKDIAGLANPTKLYTHNIDVDAINNNELKKLNAQGKLYSMGSIGNYKLVDVLKRSCLAFEKLALKVGAVVMFIKNNFDKGYVNGTLGEVVNFDNDNMPIIKTFNNQEIVATPESWIIEEDGEIKAEITQVPLRLAWAITIHKSQGVTLDAAEIDLSKSFVRGMGYVALSRVRSFDGLKLMGLNKIALKVDDDILELDKTLLRRSENTVNELNNLSILEKKEKQESFLYSIMPKTKEKPVSTYQKTKLFLEQKLSIPEIAKKRSVTEGTIMSHIEKLIINKEKLDLKYLRSGISDKRLRKIKSAFKKTKDTKLSPVKEILGDDFSYEELRLARLFFQ